MPEGQEAAGSSGTDEAGENFVSGVVEGGAHLLQLGEKVPVVGAAFSGAEAAYHGAKFIYGAATGDEQMASDAGTSVAEDMAGVMTGGLSKLAEAGYNAFKDDSSPTAHDWLKQQAEQGRAGTPSPASTPGTSSPSNDTGLGPRQSNLDDGGYTPASGTAGGYSPNSANQSQSGGGQSGGYSSAGAQQSGGGQSGGGQSSGGYSSAGGQSGGGQSSGGQSGGYSSAGAQQSGGGQSSGGQSGGYSSAGAAQSGGYSSAGATQSSGGSSSGGSAGQTSE